MNKSIYFLLLLLIAGACPLSLKGQEDHWYQKGMKSKDPEKKIEYFTKSIDTEGAKAETYLQRGDVYWNLALDAAYNPHLVVIVFDKDKTDFHNAGLMYDKAGEDYTRAIMLDPASTRALLGRCNVYQQLGKKDKALADLTHLIEIDSSNAEWYLKRGSLYCNDFRDAEKALPDLSKAIEFDAEYIDAYYVRGGAYKRLGRYELAMADYTKLIGTDPAQAHAYCYRGDIYRITGEYDKAIPDYDRAIDIDHKNYMAYNNRGLIYLIQLQYEKALDDFNKAISLQTDNFPFAYNNKGYTYLQQNKTDPAIENFEKCLAVEDSFYAADLNLALVYYMNGDKEKAAYYLGQARAKAPGLLDGLEKIISLNTDWYYWTDRDKETLTRMCAELK